MTARIRHPMTARIRHPMTAPVQRPMTVASAPPAPDAPWRDRPPRWHGREERRGVMAVPGKEGVVVWLARSRAVRMPTPEEAPPGRAALAYEVPRTHAVLGTPLQGPYPEGYEVGDFALGCFWGAERRFWEIPGVWTTLTGFQGGFTPFPVDDEVRTGLTGHAETVRVVFDPARVSYLDLLRVFWEGHDP